MHRALFETVRRYPADQQQQIFEMYRSNPNALATLRAPIFEEKVVDNLLGQVSVTDKKVSKEELTADDEEDEAKPAKKTLAKKTAAKKTEAAEDADEAEAGEPKKKAAAKKKAAKDAE